MFGAFSHVQAESNTPFNIMLNIPPLNRDASEDRPNTMVAFASLNRLKG